MDLITLRHRHPRLVYAGFTWQKEAQDLLLTYDLSLEPEVRFQPQLRFKNVPSDILSQFVENQALDPQLDRLFFHLGLAEIPSYFKAACPAAIHIKHQGQIEEKDLDFWKDLLIKGLGEFYYQNSIDFTAKDFFTLTLESTASKKDSADQGTPTTKFQKGNQTVPLIPIGGGKDSATVLALMEEKKIPYDILLLAPHSPAAKTIAQLMQKEGHCQHIIELERKIDPQLLALNQQGYLNGHTPFSAYLAFASVTTAHLYGCTHVLLGNEASSEEENLMYLGHAINHQYSKSLDFERKFQKYVQESLFVEKNPPQYLSILRSLSELEIAEKFCSFAAQDDRFAAMLTIFRSCNVGQQKNSWCHNCPKCAFVFTLFSAFLDEQIVQRDIFQENLFAKESLQQTFLDLAGLGDKKPFECVGTFTEVRQAIALAWQKNKAGDKHLRSLYKKTAAHDLMEKLAQSSILILGMGREGQSSLTFLRQHFPDKKLAVADQEEKSIDQNLNVTSYFGKDYLKHLSEYQIIIKTPGIPLETKELQEAISGGSQVLSNTQIFFILCKGKIIGITGTKGKSTTSQLLYQILYKAQTNTVLLGNIGEAPLNLLEKIDSETWVVDELSCHQLAQLPESPEVSIVLDIKSEHLDYYKDFASYFQAKTAIARYQKANDWLIYNASLEGSKKMAELSLAQKFTHSLKKDGQALVYEANGQIFYKEEAIIATNEVPLYGEHNLYNVMPAILVAKLLGVANDDIAQAIRSFQNLPHRLQLVATVSGVRYFDDSIAVNPHATIMAIKSFPKDPIILIAGGYERHQDFEEMAEVMATSNIKQLIALPTTGQRLIDDLGKKTNGKIPSQLVQTLEEAVSLAQKSAQEGDIVLLSPASASYNSFNNYEERGKAFLQAIKTGIK